MRAFLQQLTEHPTLGPMVAHQRWLEGSPPAFAEPRRPLPAALAAATAGIGIDRLYTHQARALDLARDGHNVLLATPTASGKTLCFATAVLESCLVQPGSKALFLYPTKALARDQLNGLRELAGGLGALNAPRFEIYDGDTTAGRRRRIKADPPEVLITNPDMLHLGILAHHHDWASFLSGLRWVVLDELHVYRGIFGAHVHHILARLRRLCERYGSRPQFIAASATVGNPEEFASTLVGRPFHVVDTSGAPCAGRGVVFVNPVAVSPYTAAVRVVAESIRHGHRTIAFTKARRITELLHTWLVRLEPRLARSVAPYRAGYLAEERRSIEARLFRGELLAVLTTSALELGIDVGALDVCVLVGYPGSLISSWQRIGRVGRERDGLVVLVALPDALDQYVVHHPELFFGRAFEKVVLDPWNPLVASQHLVCAAAEEPLVPHELDRGQGRGRDLADELVQDGRLVVDAEGQRWFSFRRRPQGDVNPRSAGRVFSIVERTSGKLLGTIDGIRVHHECHPGAIYLHGGRSYRVVERDDERRRVVAEPARVDYYTVVLGEKETAILDRIDTAKLGPFPISLGRLRVTVRIRGYQKKRLFGGELISRHPLDAPPLVFETIGFWIELPPDMPRVFTERGLHFMGAIHAVEHATIGLFPLLAIADRGDVGGISYTGHPQTGCPSIFVYDGVPGGAGLAEQGFRDLRRLLERTRELVASCSCEAGCPSCIQSPKCGNGNKPLDKGGALLILATLLGETTLAELGVAPGPDRSDEPLRPFVGAAPEESSGRHGIRRAGNLPARSAAGVVEQPAAAAPTDAPNRPVGSARQERTLIFDLETQRGAEDVGGWANTPKMGLALAVVYDVQRVAYRTYFEADVDRLLLDLVMADCVVGFNIDRFDLQVLSGYTEWDLGRVRTLDMLSEVHRQLGFRISLNHLSEANLGQSKTGDGLQSLRWWKEGRINLIEQYCRKDVQVTRELYELGRRQNYLLYRDHADRMVRVPVRW